MPHLPRPPNLRNRLQNRFPSATLLPVPPLTIYDIAHRAGVSPSTVSRLLSGARPVSPALAARVQAILAATPFQPSRLARGLRRRASNLVGLLVPSLTDPYSVALLHGVAEALRASRAGLLVASTNHDAARAGEETGRLLDFRVEAMLLATFVEAGTLGRLLDLRVRVLGVDTPAGNAPSVLIDWAQTASAAADLIAAHRHRRIALVGFDPGEARLHQIADAFSRALRDTSARGFTVGKRPQATDLSSAAEATAGLLAGASRPSVMVCASPAIAAGVYLAAAERGIRIPHELSVLVTGLLAEVPGGMLSPRLSGWAVPADPLGHRLAALLANPDVAPGTREVVAMPYVQGASFGAAGA